MGGQNHATVTAADYLFKKIRTFKDNGEVWTPRKLMDGYMEVEREIGYACFSMPSYMSESKVTEYNKKIQSGNCVRILFGVNDETVDNDIGYSADVLEVYVFQNSGFCPWGEDGNIPEFRGESNTTWMKVRRLKEERNIRADMLIIKSNGESLKDRICHSQCHFAYVSLK